MMISVNQRIVHVTEEAGVVSVCHAAADVRIVQHIVHARRAIGEVRFRVRLGRWICVIGTTDFIIIDIQGVVIVVWRR